MSTTADLPDLTGWLTLVWPEHSHHHHAVRDWEAQASEHVLFSTVTALGLVRLVSFDRDFERFPGLQRLLLP